MRLLYKKAQVVFFVSVLLLLSIALAALFYNSQQDNKMHQVLEQSHQILHLMENYADSMHDSLYHTQSFIITGDERHLKEQQKRIMLLNTVVEQLAQKIPRHTLQYQRLVELNALAQKRIAQLKIATQDSQTKDSQTSLSLFNETEYQHMLAFDAKLEEIKNSELILIKDEERVVQKIQDNYALTLVVLLVSSIILLVQGFRVTQHEMRSRKRTQEEAMRYAHEMSERVKEISCLRDITFLSQQSENDVAQMLTRCVERIPAGWLQPPLTCARIKFDQQLFCTAGFKETRWKLSANMPLSGTVAGLVEVCYLDESVQHSPFLAEELDLIQSIANQLAQSLERKWAEEKLAELNRDFVLFLENTSDFIYFKDERGRFRFCSQTLASISGHVSWRDMIGKHDLEVFPADTAQIYYQEEQPIYQEGKTLLNKIDPYYDEQGQLRWVSTNKWPVWNETSDKVIGLFGISRDVTENIETMKQLQKSEERLRATIESAMDAVVQIDTQGRIISWNRPAELMFGWRSQEVLGQAIHHTIIPPQYREAHIQGVKNFLRTGKSSLFDKRIEVSAQHRDGHEFPIELTIAPIHIGEQYEFSAFIRDITARKQHEDELLRSNAELEQFSYAVSHDMRQPLRMVSSYLQLIELDLATQLQEEHRNYFSAAIEGAKRIDQMLVALLEYSRVGRMGEPAIWIESRILLDEALQFLQPALLEADANLSIQGSWPCIFVSQNEITRLLQNLIGNAIKYHVAGQPPKIEINSEVVRNEWRLCVCDNGIGIVPSQIKRLFKVFQRLQSRVAYEGTGIGLALCRKIAEHHHGRIWVESAGEGFGSQFYVSLPVLKDISNGSNDDNGTKQPHAIF